MFPKACLGLCICGSMLVATALRSHAQDAPKTAAAALVEAENNVSVKLGETPWQKAEPVMPLAVGNIVQTGEFSRATVRLSHSSVARLDELTRAEIVPPNRESGKAAVNLSAGALYFFSREKANELEVLTPAATGALRGTEFVVRVESGGRTRITMLDGVVELSNAAGSVTLHSGEQGEAEIGQPPRKTAMIEAKNIIQWTLYYPAVLDPEDLNLSDAERRAVADSLAAYIDGDLLGALERYPKNHRPTSPGGRLFRAGVLLAVGRLDVAMREMERVPADAPGRLALEQMIAAVRFTDWTRTATPQTAGEWMAASYYLQSKAELELARTAAKRATEVAPGFGYAWVRLANLEFSFGRTSQALRELTRGLELTPRNAQGYALRGYMLSAQNSIRQARAAFDEAIRLDGALGNAWLGRGLTYMRERRDEEGLQDLQTAAVLEPNRSIFRSYLGKVFSVMNRAKTANLDLERAKELDPNDPTPWLYSAIQRKQENRYNQAVDDLEKSVALNDNRQIFRSKFLLDQDRSIRGTNLAAIYLNDGMQEQSIREAVLAVNSDYSSAPAHLFLANSYNALRDPTRVLLRYETPWFSELLLSNMLSPVGGGPLSQFVSEQEYSKMFQQDGFGMNSVTQYLSNGQMVEVGSQYGTFGNFSYALDAEYYYSNGQRLNNDVSRFEGYATIKFQLTPRDTLFFQAKFQRLETGDVLQRYDQSVVNNDRSALTTNFSETQVPGLLLAGYHHEWTPGHHTLLLAGRLENNQSLSAQDTTQALLARDVSLFTVGLPFGEDDFNLPFNNPQIQQTLQKLTGKGLIEGLYSAPFDLSYNAGFVTYSLELQQIATTGPNTLIAGVRYQKGQFDTSVRMTSKDPTLATLFDSPPAHQDYSVGMNRLSLYVYDTFRVAPWLSLTGALTYDRMEYPDNFRSPPINGGQRELEKFLPKAGFILQPTSGTVIRGACGKAISGASFDESVRLEPTQVAGFTQAYRTLASESLIGSVAGSEYQFWGASVEQKLPTRTYMGVMFLQMEQNIDQTIGTFDFLDSLGNYPNEILPSSLGVKYRYRERVLSASINQLVGNYWSLGARYTFTKSEFSQDIPELQKALKTPLADPTTVPDIERNAHQRWSSALNQLSLFVIFNHPSGFFFQGEANWFAQTNCGFELPRTGDNFWQYNLYGGYRFYKNQCEIGCGILNIGGGDYQLEPLTPYAELPRERTFMARVKISF